MAENHEIKTERIADKGVVVLLEQMLEEAKAGKIKSICGVYARDNFRPVLFDAGEMDPALMIGGLNMAAHLLAVVAFEEWGVDK